MLKSLLKTIKLRPNLYHSLQGKFLEQMFHRKTNKKRSTVATSEVPSKMLKTESAVVESDMTSVSILPTPVKSESDKKEYRLVKLSNGITALLIDSTHAVCRAAEEGTSQNMCGSDEESGDDDEEESEDEDEALAACSLMVNVGSFSDPRDIQGLAHFLEHMIFMGSEKYPAENDFDAFVNKSGGSNNADTNSEETSYYFEVREKYLEEGLDRFTQLFIAPLMPRDAMEREKVAVDSEFQQKINIEGSRREQLLATFGNPECPCSIFPWGNLITLKENVDDDKLYSDVHEFRKRHYSGHRMYVALQSRKSLDKLQKLVEKYFTPIPNNELPEMNFKSFSHTNAFKKDFHDKVFYLKAKSDINKLDLTWCLPSVTKKYKTKSDEFISSIMGHEGKGSLCSYFRRNLLGLDVHAGIEYSGFENNSIYSLFTISVMLTDKGVSNLKDVLKACFSYLRLLEREPVNEHSFRELQQIENNSFKFQTEKQAIENVENLVVSTKYYAPRDVIGGSVLYYEYNEQEIREVISHLNTKTFNVMLTTKQQYPGIEYNLKEKWFGTEYSTVDFPAEWSELWDAKDIYPEMHLPEKNEFVPTQFNIHPIPEKHMMHPEKIFDTPVIELWHKQDDKFLLPHASMLFYLTNDTVRKDARQLTLLNLYSLVMRYYLAESLYPATLTGASYQLYSAELGITIKVSGFNEKLHKIVEIVTKILADAPEKIEDSVVEVMKTQLFKNYRNTFINSKKFNSELRLLLLQDHYQPSYLKHKELPDISSSDLRTFIRQFNSKLKIIGLVQGNVTKAQAATVGSILIDNLNPSQLDTEIKKQAKQLPIGSKYLRIKSLRQNDVNSTITNYYQIGPSSVSLTAMLDFLISLMEEPLFDNLRTKEQLGYDVAVEVRDTFNILGFTITIRSQENKFTSIVVDQKIEEFCKNFEQTLANMTSEDFNTAKDSLIKLKSMPDTELKDEVTRNWAEITEDEHVFDRRFKEVEHLKRISKENLSEFYRNILKADNKRKLSIQVVGNATVIETTEDEKEEESHVPVTLEYLQCDSCINDIYQYKADLELYPARKTLID